MNIVIIVQARMNSTRLPGKVLKKVHGKTLLEYQIDRLKHVRKAHKIVVATTNNNADNKIVMLCKDLNIECFRGDEHNVLSRYYNTAKAHHADTVVRITSDCTIIDPAVIDHVISHYIDKFPAYDYVSNSLTRTYPRGMDTEVFSFKALEKAFLHAKEQSELEHVTPYIYKNPEIFKLSNVSCEQDNSYHRWTVDTPEDFTLISNILENVYPTKHNFTMQDVLAYLDTHEDLFFINSHIEQKNL
ncbi:MAG: glycosyltransferase family protein [bacterium]